MVEVVFLSSVAFVMAVPDGVIDPDVLKDLVVAHQETAKYHDIGVALADGYIPVSPCVEVPGPGIVGIHYVNFDFTADLVLGELTPETLIYVPIDEGMELVGVEYFVADVGQPAPNLFGQALHGSMHGHDPGELPHYELHVRLWQGNPENLRQVQPQRKLLPAGGSLTLYPE